MRLGVLRYSAGSHGAVLRAIYANLYHVLTLVHSWVLFKQRSVLSHPFRKERGMDGAPASDQFLTPET